MNVGDRLDIMSDIISIRAKTRMCFILSSKSSPPQLVGGDSMMLT